METEFKQEYINIGTPLVMNKTEKKKKKQNTRVNTRFSLWAKWCVS